MREEMQRRELNGDRWRPLKRRMASGPPYLHQQISQRKNILKIIIKKSLHFRNQNRIPETKTQIKVISIKQN